MNFKIILFILISAAASFAQELLTLQDAIQIALKNNFSITIASGEKEIAANNLSLGNAGFLPELDAEGTYSESNTTTRQEYFDGRTIDRSGAKANNLNAAVALNWTIFDGFRMFASLDKLKRLNEIGELNYKLAVENNIADITFTYYDLVRQGVVLEVITRSIAISEERVKLADQKRDVGSGSKFELLQAQADLNEDRSLLLQAELNYSQSKTRLNQLLGRNADAEFSVSDTIIYSTDLNLNELKNEVLERNSELRRAEENVNLAQTELSIARSGLFPQISLFGSYNFLRSESEAGFTKSNQNRGFTYGVRASWNLFNGLNTRRQMENAAIGIEISETGLSEVKNRVEAELQNLYKAYENSLRLVELESDNLQITEENVNIALERLRLGNITQLEFREAQVNLIDAQSRLVNAQFAAKNAETELLRLSGRLIQ